MNHLIVAHYREPLDWLGDITAPYTITVVRNGVHRPNEGREAGAYCHWIFANYDRLQDADTCVFVQGDPFDHCPDLCEQLARPFAGFTSLGAWRTWSDGGGLPHHAGLPVAAGWERWVGGVFPGYIEFVPGGQFAISGELLLRRPVHWWRDIAKFADDGTGPWVLERLWEHIFGR